MKRYISQVEVGETILAVYDYNIVECEVISNEPDIWKTTTGDGFYEDIVEHIHHDHSMKIKVPGFKNLYYRRYDDFYDKLGHALFHSEIWNDPSPAIEVFVNKEEALEYFKTKCENMISLNNNKIKELNDKNGYIYEHMKILKRYE